MSKATSSPRKIRLSTHLALVVFSVAAMVVLTQCKLTSDRVTGVDNRANQAAHGQCVSNCAHEANTLMKTEQDLHKANVDACAGDPTCLANEEARHEAAVAAIQAGRKACMDGCHEQGGGQGGR